ncbi:MAG TPA: sensor histidine kinase, partial [Caldithrix sp.]|nr:sensor histidine kinase [Caldithrix sp.]
YYIAIRLEGQSIEELAQWRFYRSLVLIFFIDLIILIGVWIIYRNIRAEMRLTQMKADFVSNVSHELRTPLSLIRMFAETLELNRVQTENKKKEYYQIIGQESERLTHLINNILDFSKIEAGKKQYHKEIFDLNEVIKDVLRLYAFHLQNKGFHLQNEINPAEKLKINADKDAITEAIINLIDNAVKYSNEDKRLRIKSGLFQDAVYFEVEDHGIGIGIDDQKKIFDKFYRVSTGLVHDVKGTGLGLSLIKYIMEMHNGRVSVESHLGKGSTFRLIFPKER